MFYSMALRFLMLLFHSNHEEYIYIYNSYNIYYPHDCFEQKNWKYVKIEPRKTLNNNDKRGAALQEFWPLRLSLGSGSRSAPGVVERHRCHLSYATSDDHAIPHGKKKHIQHCTLYRKTKHNNKNQVTNNKKTIVFMAKTVGSVGPRLWTSDRSGLNRGCWCQEWLSELCRVHDVDGRLSGAGHPQRGFGDDFRKEIFDLY